MKKCNCEDLLQEAAEYQGRKVTLNNPTRSSDGKKKFYVYVKNEKGNVIKLGFGDPNMEIKRDDPARRKSFRARHNCDRMKQMESTILVMLSVESKCKS